MKNKNLCELFSIERDIIDDLKWHLTRYDNFLNSNSWQMKERKSLNKKLKKVRKHILKKLQLEISERT